MKASKYYFSGGVMFIRGLALFLCFAPSFLHAKEKWQQREQEKDITVYSQKIDGSGAARLKGVLYLPFSVDDAAKILMDIPNQITFIPFCKTIQVLKEELLGLDRKRTLVYQVNAIPVVSDRDMVLEALTWSENKDAQRIWRSEFKAVSDKGPPATKGMVRIAHLKGNWRLAPAPDEKGSILTYMNHAELGGLVPNFIVDSVRIKNMVKLLKGLRQRCMTVYRK